MNAKWTGTVLWEDENAIAKYEPKPKPVDLWKDDEWNAVHLVVQGQRVAYKLNGQLIFSIEVDPSAHRNLAGGLGFRCQNEKSAAASVEFKDIRLRQLSDPGSPAADGTPKTP